MDIATKTRPPARATQARGNMRRVALLAAARDLLMRSSLDQVGIIAVAEQAEIPISSAYHFFPDINELWKELARVVAAQQASEDLDLPQVDRWDALVELSLRHHQAAFNNDPSARQLLLGAGTPPEIKHAGCKEDFRFGAALWQALRQQFILPDLADSQELFFKALLIADVFFSLSVADHGQVSDEARLEATRATVAYLSLYLPPQLAPQPAPPAAGKDGGPKLKPV